MAPLAVDLQNYETFGGPTVTLLGLVFLFVIIINLINLCTSCQKQSFELQQPGAKVERNSSTLVRVVKLEDALTARENPAIDEIQKDEQELSPVPEEQVPDTSTQDEGFTPWRTHTITKQSAFPEETQVGNGAPAGDMDRTTPARHELQAVPMIASHTEVETSVQYSSPVISNYSAPGDSQDRAGLRPEPLANHTGEVTQGPEVPGVRPQHTYETVSDMLRQQTPEPVEGSEEPLDVPSYQFVTQLEPYSTVAPDLTPARTAPAPRPAVEVGEIADLDDELSDGMYARVSKRIKCPTPPPVPPPEDEEEDVEEVAPPLPERALDTEESTQRL